MSGGLLRFEQLHHYQLTAINHLLKFPQSMLIMDMSLGKTVVVLTALNELMRQGFCKGALVIAPLRVCQTVWRQQAEQWDHLAGRFTFETIHGGESHRALAVRRQATVWLVNYEGIPWLVRELWHVYLNRGRELPFDTVVFDEVQRLKSTRVEEGEGGVRGRALLSILPHVGRRIGMTGTPSPNGLLDLFGQYLVLDGGQRLGWDYMAYRERFFEEKPSGFGFQVTELGRQNIHRLVSDMTFELRAEDHLELPSYQINDVMIELPPKLRKIYDGLEREMWLALGEGMDLECTTGASLRIRLLQLANGAVFNAPGSRDWTWFHDLKLDALEEVFEGGGRRPLLVAYQYQHDKERIQKRFGKRGLVTLDARVNEREARKVVGAWNQGQIPFLMGHAASIGHGLNLQFGSNQVAWFGVGDNLEGYLQFNARLRRQGQPGKWVTVHRLLCSNTVDEVAVAALLGKQSDQENWRTALREYKQRRTGNG